MAGFLFTSLLNLLEDAGEHRWFLLSELSKYLAIELEATLLHCADEGAVGLEAVLTESRVEADDPELAIVVFLVLAVCEGILTRVNE